MAQSAPQGGTATAIAGISQMKWKKNASLPDFPSLLLRKLSPLIWLNQLY
jgi:hypothetical protein